MRVVWTEPAETDLDDLFDYIARDSPVYAERPWLPAMSLSPLPCPSC